MSGDAGFDNAIPLETERGVVCPNAIPPVDFWREMGTPDPVLLTLEFAEFMLNDCPCVNAEAPPAPPNDKEGAAAELLEEKDGIANGLAEDVDSLVFPKLKMGPPFDEKGESLGLLVGFD